MTRKIFVVDDDPFWIAIIQKTLKNIGYNDIATYSNGADCIANLNQNPELVFVDYQMADMNGLEVLKAVKKYDQGIAVVFCTGHQDLNVAVDAIQYGSYDYLLKENVNRKELLNVIGQLVNA